jgi:hypothetical protein
MIDSKSITYTQLDDEIHSIKIHNSNRQTIEEIFNLFTEVAQSASSDKTNLYLVDSNGIDELPVRYLIQRADKWEKEQSFFPASRTAVIYNSNHVMRFAVNMLIKKFAKYDNQTRIFSGDQRDEAIAWLKSSD